MNGLAGRSGHDPLERGDRAALYAEMAKLHHPACPDIDWRMVEHWCRELLRDNGGDLQVATFLALALTRRYGLAGMAEGVTLLRRLLTGAWDALWPRKATERVDLLAWLAVQLQPLLRGLEVGERDMPLMRNLEADLACLQEVLGQHRQPAVTALRTLAEQIEKLGGRLERNGLPVLQGSHGHTLMSPDGPVKVVIALPGERPVAPLLYLETIPAPRPVRRGGWLVLWSLLGLLVAMLSGALAWNAWLRMQEDARMALEPIRLDSLTLFGAGSAELKPDSTRLLIRALADVKAQPGWLIVITGHTDSSGDQQRNLELSRVRAEVVRDWMKSMGDLPDDCFAVGGHGAGQPIADNTTEAGRAANRRVDISLVPEPGSCQAGSVAG
jgi:type VI secretion system protein VasL